MLAAHFADELPLWLGECLGAAAVAARHGRQAGHSTLLESIIPALQSRYAEMPRAHAARRPHRLTRDLRQRRMQLPAGENSVHERANQLTAKDGDFFAVILRDELLHQGLHPLAADIAVIAGECPSHSVPSARAPLNRWEEIPRNGAAMTISSHGWPRFAIDARWARSATRTVRARSALAPRGAHTRAVRRS